MADTAPAAVGASQPKVATVIVPDREDPASVLARGGLEVTWKDGTKTKKFKKVECEQITDDDLSLPTLFLHFLGDEFKVKPGEVDPSMRSGNDNAEVQVVLPEKYTGAALPTHDADMREALEVVLDFLRDEAMVPVSALTPTPSGSGPRQTYSATANPTRWYFTLKTSRPKADINMDREPFGMPEECEMYLFAENHVSVDFMTEDQQEAFEMCLNDLMESEEEDLCKFAVFLKVFYEGAFVYNKKVATGQGSYLPKLAGLAALGVAPAFEGQAGISTTHPYRVRPEFLNFSDSVNVTIKAIREMSDRHQRYGLCFTRCVYVWEDENFDTSKTLCFSSILPQGGFFYIPETLERFQKEGGLVYAFGDKATSVGAALASDMA